MLSKHQRIMILKFKMETATRMDQRKEYLLSYCKIPLSMGLRIKQTICVKKYIVKHL